MSKKSETCLKNLNYAVNKLKKIKMYASTYFTFLGVMCFLFGATIISCHAGENDVMQDNALTKALVAKGKEVFFYNCVACHNFNYDGIGPRLAGVSKQVSTKWLVDFINKPKSIIDSGDLRAVALYEKFGSYMPNFSHLTKEKMKALIAYIETHEDSVPLIAVDDNDKLEDPIVETIKAAKLSVNLDFVFQIPPSSEGVPATRITKLASRMGSDDIFVLDLNGILYSVRNGNPMPYFNLAKEVPNFIKSPGLATGFGSFAFHPNFEKNGLLYTTHTEPRDTAPADFSYHESIPVTLQWVVLEWKTKAPKALSFKGKSRELFRIDMVVQYHGIQNIDFNSNATQGNADYGHLYLGVGDGGAVERGFHALAGSNSLLWGSILRIDPQGTNSTNGHYGIPSNNPFANEIYAYGFRNPHRFSWTSGAEERTDKMIATNIGHHNVESIYIVEPGLNFGWPQREGAFVIRPEGNMSYVYALPDESKGSGYTYPVAQYDHDEGNAICGGYLYEGEKVSALYNKYIFGDIVNGRVFYIDGVSVKNGANKKIKELQLRINNEAVTLKSLTGKDRAELRLGIDSHNEIYIFSKNDGKVYVLSE